MESSLRPVVLVAALWRALLARPTRRHTGCTRGFAGGVALLLASLALGLAAAVAGRCGGRRGRCCAAQPAAASEPPAERRSGPDRTVAIHRSDREPRDRAEPRRAPPRQCQTVSCRPEGDVAPTAPPAGYCGTSWGRLCSSSPCTSSAQTASRRGPASRRRARPLSTTCTPSPTRAWTSSRPSGTPSSAATSAAGCRRASSAPPCRSTSSWASPSPVGRVRTTQCWASCPTPTSTATSSPTQASSPTWTRAARRGTTATSTGGRLPSSAPMAHSSRRRFSYATGGSTFAATCRRSCTPSTRDSTARRGSRPRGRTASSTSSSSTTSSRNAAPRPPAAPATPTDPPPCLEGVRATTASSHGIRRPIRTSPCRSVHDHHPSPKCSAVQWSEDARRSSFPHSAAVQRPPGQGLLPGRPPAWRGLAPQALTS